MSPHSGADCLVQAELPPTSPEILTVFTSLACSPGASPYCHRNTAGCWAGIGEDCRPRTTWRPLTLFGQPGSHSFATHWRYCHADETVPRQDVNSSFPSCVCHPIGKVFALTQVRDPRESAAACCALALGTPSTWPRTSDVVNMLEESALNYHIVLQ